MTSFDKVLLWHLREHVANALLVGVVKRNESDHAPLVHQRRDRRVELAEWRACAGVQLRCQIRRVRDQIGLQRLLLQPKQDASEPSMVIGTRASQPCICNEPPMCGQHDLC